MGLVRRLLIAIVIPLLFLAGLTMILPGIAFPALAETSQVKGNTLQFGLSVVVTGTQVTEQAIDESDDSAADLADYEALVPDPLPPRTDLPIWVISDQPFTYTFTITNVGSVRATDVVFYDSLPEAVTLQEIRADRTQCEGQVDIICRFGDLEPGDSVKIYLVVLPTQAGLITNIGRVGSNEVDPKKDTSKRTKLHVVIPADLVDGDPVVSEIDTADVADSGQPLHLYFPLLLKMDRAE
jgi:uncharacterized repeat protein (TIGR01451 family)